MRIGLIGGGGLAKEVSEIATLNGYDIAGYFADQPGTTRWKYLGTFDDVLHHRNNMQFTLCIGAVNADGVSRRRALIDYFSKSNINFANLISPHAVVSEGVILGKGLIVAHGVVLSVDAMIGDFCLLNTNAVVGHDANVGSNCILAPLSFLGGNTFLEQDVIIAPHASVLEGRKIHSGCVVGTGAVVYRDLKSNSTVMPVVTKTLKFQ